MNPADVLGILAYVLSVSAVVSLETWKESKTRAIGNFLNFCLVCFFFLFQHDVNF